MPIRMGRLLDPCVVCLAMSQLLLGILKINSVIALFLERDIVL